MDHQMPAAPFFYSKREVAQILGLAPMTVHRLTKAGKLASVKLGARVLIPREAIDRLLAQALGEDSK